MANPSWEGIKASVTLAAGGAGAVSDSWNVPQKYPSMTLYIPVLDASVVCKLQSLVPNTGAGGVSAVWMDVSVIDSGGAAAPVDGIGSTAAGAIVIPNGNFGGGTLRLVTTAGTQVATVTIWVLFS